MTLVVARVESNQIFHRIRHSAYAPASRAVARCSTSNAKCRDTPLMKTLTRGGCPNGAPTAQSEFCRVTPHSKRFLVTFWRKQKVTRPPGRTPGTRTQPRAAVKRTNPNLAGKAPQPTSSGEEGRSPASMAEAASTISCGCTTPTPAGSTRYSRPSSSINASRSAAIRCGRPVCVWMCSSPVAGSNLSRQTQGVFSRSTNTRCGPF